MEKINKNQGLIKTVILIVIALIVLGYFGFNIQDILNAETVRSNLSYAWDLTKDIWNNYLSAPFNWFWDNVVIDLVWNNIKELFEGDSKETVLNQVAE